MHEPIRDAVGTKTTHPEVNRPRTGTNSHETRPPGSALRARRGGGGGGGHLRAGLAAPLEAQAGGGGAEGPLPRPLSTFGRSARGRLAAPRHGGLASPPRRSHRRSSRQTERLSERCRPRSRPSLPKARGALHQAACGRLDRREMLRPVLAGGNSLSITIYHWEVKLGSHARMMSTLSSAPSSQGHYGKPS